MDLTSSTRILLTGGGGFLGRQIARKLRERGFHNIIIPWTPQWDLRKKENIDWFMQDPVGPPDVIIHAAARAGGIGLNREKPGELFYNNAIMGIQLMEAARQAGVKKYVQIGTICSYPKVPPTIPFVEDDLWSGYPEETNAAYGLSKKMLLVQAQAYRQQYDFNAIYLMPVNMYGPWDNFDPETSHVIPALIRKFVEAVEDKEIQVKLWGDGSASREFLYVEDCAEAIVLALEKYDGADPINIGIGQEITIRELARMIAKIVGFEGRILYDTSKPNGQPRRCLDTSKAYKEFGFKAKTDLKTGLEKTVDWYLKNRKDSL